MITINDGRSRLYEHYVSTHGSGSSGGGTLWARRNILRRLPAGRDVTILDIGCGAGDVVALMRAAGYRHSCGIDISEEQVDLARARQIDGVECADLREFLGLARDKYDVIVALDVLEHFDSGEILDLLDLVAGALKPGGRLIARTPNAASPFFGRYRYGDLTHGLAFTVRSLRQALASTGFARVEFSAVDPVPHGPLSAARFVLWQMIAAGFKLCLAIETGQVRGHVVTQNIVVTAHRY